MYLISKFSQTKQPLKPSAIAALLCNNWSIIVLYGIFLQNVFFFFFFFLVSYLHHLELRVIYCEKHLKHSSLNRTDVQQILQYTLFIFLIETHCTLRKFVCDTQNKGFRGILSTACSCFSFSVLRSERNQMCTPLYKCVLILWNLLWKHTFLLYSWILSLML